MSSIVNFRTTLAAGICAIISYLVYVNQREISAAIGWAATILFAVLIVLIIGFALLYWKRETTRHARLEDGSFPLLRFKMNEGATMLVDPNLMPAGAGIFHPRHGWMQIAPPDWKAQMQYAATVQTTRHLEALTPGDNAQMRTHGAISTGRGGIANSATAKWLEGAYKPTPKALPVPPPVQAAPANIPSTPRLALTDALAQSTGQRWIVGQSDDGNLAAFEPARHAHAGIVGATGTGKTRSVGYALALAAIRSGWHVIILDPDGGNDWQPFASHAEWHETDRTTFPGQMETVHALFERRAAANNPRPVLGIIEEYGDLIRQVRRASRSDADAVDSMLDSILQRGRKRRIHLALIDQYPEHWSPAVVGGTKFRAVFQLGPNQGAKMEEYKAGQLRDVGRFLVRGIEYNSWDASAALPALLRQLPAPASTRRVINGTCTRVPASSPVGSVNSLERFAQEVAPPSPPASEPTEPGGPTDYQQAAADYLAANPQATQTNLRHALSISKAYANELWHILSPCGNNYVFPAEQMDMSNDNDRATFAQLLRAGAVTFPEPKEKSGAQP